jgi:hypothetical protein
VKYTERAIQSKLTEHELYDIIESGVYLAADLRHISMWSSAEKNAQAEAQVRHMKTSISAMAASGTDFWVEPREYQCC